MTEKERMIVNCAYGRKAIKEENVRTTFVFEREIHGPINFEKESFDSYEQIIFNCLDFKLKDLQLIKIETLDHEGNVIDVVETEY